MIDAIDRDGQLVNGYKSIELIYLLNSFDHLDHIVQTTKNYKKQQIE